MIETAEKTERLIMVGICTDNISEDWVNVCLDELALLIDTAGAEAVGRMIQKRENVHPGTYLGKGKIDELKELIWELDADGIVCDDELSPAQLKNLEDALACKVMDRTLVILDIFAAHAVTSEGKIQVELAQLRYRATRLVGLRNSLSRLGGGIGTRGPGEKKLEMDRRLIHERIGNLKAELAEVVERRNLNRVKRQKNNMTVAAIVGYTNAGKSTMLNKLTGSNVLSENKLFATLDPTTRAMTLGSGEEILLTDTVGFINKLPHHLIDAFRSTLEEAVYADIIIHVADASDPELDSHMHVVYDTLRTLGVEDKTFITVFNKADLLDEEARANLPKDFAADHIICASAKTGEGLDELSLILEQILRERKVYICRLFQYHEAGKIALIRKYGQLLEEEYQPDGIMVKGFIPKEYVSQVSE